MPWSMMPRPMVVATLSWKMNRAMKLNAAASITAWYGFNTRVETTVAMELAASWKPFMKSKASATKISATTMPRLSCETSISVPGILQHNAFDQVGDVLAAIGDGLEPLVDGAQLDQLLYVRLVAEQLRHRRAHDAVGGRLQAVDFVAGLQDRFGLLHVLQHRHRGTHALAAHLADLGELPG